MELDHLLSEDLIKKLTGKYGLPLHLYFPDRIARNVQEFKGLEKIYPRLQICFAVKCNPCRGAIRTANSLGIGVDVVSEFELQAALEEGVSPDIIVCNGNAKTDDYLRLIVQSGALAVVDSEFEVECLDALADQRQVPVLVRFAGMPLEGLTAADQSTALSWTKFGFPADEAALVFRKIQNFVNIRIVGISAHIGTQICDPIGYGRLGEHLISIARVAYSLGVRLEYINIGGGYPVNYLSEVDWLNFQQRLANQLAGNAAPADWATWDNIPMGFKDFHQSSAASLPKWEGKAYWSTHPGAAMVRYFLEHILPDGNSVKGHLNLLGEPKLILEPGRAIIGTAGITLAEVMGVKQVMGNNLVAVNLGIVNHGTLLVTPDIFPVSIFPLRDDDAPVEAFLAGRLCFTGDMLSKVKLRLNRMPIRGDVLIIHHTGAYSADHFASHSCGFPLPPKVAIYPDDREEVWRPAEQFQDVFLRNESYCN